MRPWIQPGIPWLVKTRDSFGTFRTLRELLNSGIGPELFTMIQATKKGPCSYKRLVTFRRISMGSYFGPRAIMKKTFQARLSFLAVTSHFLRKRAPRRRRRRRRRRV